MTVNFRFILSTWHFTSTVQGSKWKKYSYSDIDIMTSRYQDIKISTSKQRRFQAGIFFFFHKIKKWTFHEIQFSLYGLYHLFNGPNLFPKFHVIEKNSFSKTRKSFFLKKHKTLAVFPHICLKASTFTDNRQKSGKKRFCYSEVILGYTIL